MENWVVLLLLLIFGIADIRKRSFSVYALVAAIAVSAALRLFCTGNMVQGLIGGISGGVVCVMGKISRGQIGGGDGILLVATGLLLGFWGNMELFLAGLFFCAAFSVYAIVLLKKGRGYRIPFVPFLAGAQLFRIFVLL